MDPPAHIDLPAAARPYWDWIVTARARDRWLPIDLANAAELATLYADVARMRARVTVDGDVGEDGKAHPLHKVISDATRRVIALSRLLHVHPEATEGRSRDAGNALQNERKAAEAQKGSLPANVARLIPRVG
jgi:phage terminase small subunit